ncbi:MAG: tRNA epoxyqueuosine(34) reductase QueG [Candidatus Tectomicrobia bacterium]
MENQIRAKAAALGFSWCGFARLAPLPREEFFRNWLAQGHAGEMHYLAREPERRIDPAIPFPQAKSVICLGYPYAPPALPDIDWRTELRGRIAAYAAGPDYHDVITAKLHELTVFLKDIQPDVWARPYVDTGPLLEREWAYRSGLGWFGKNTMLLRKQAGSWFFLAEVLVDVELEGEGIPHEHCGRCTQCLNDCPTNALEEGYILKSPLCISYLTIEHRGPIPYELRPKLGNWIFGCDICQAVCPWNKKFGQSQQKILEALFPSLPELMKLDDEGFRKRFRKTALWRTKRRGLLRNVAIALGNSGNPEAISPLSTALHDPEPLIRGHAAWALGQLDEKQAKRALQQCIATENDPQVQAEIRVALGQEPASVLVNAVSALPP